MGKAEYYVNREPLPFGPSLHLSILYIHKDWQRHGIGRRLIDAGIAEAHELAVSTLTTQPEAKASDFYNQADFVRGCAPRRCRSKHRERCRRR